MQNEADYLRDYRAGDFPAVLVTVDSVLFTLIDEKLCVLMVQRANHPQLGYWGLPGGFIDQRTDASTQDTALRKLVEKCGVKPAWLEQLATFSGRDRDPRGWSLTTAYFALIGWQTCQPHIRDVSDARWIPVEELAHIDPIAFDHREIIAVARERLEQKTLYSMVPVYCLGEEFTLTELQGVIEAILQKPIQRKSLVRRFESSEMFEETGKMAVTGARQAKVYRRKAGVDGLNFSRNLGG
ncbi:NUDIX hydrolase [Enterobacillus tribolii]|uniref:ADP-ribose pyrophosphatase YjhB (NUDIX family) n=1 Tax=Enterobacillus tribolii TaxID=1487935 RepID=A0A370QNY4_9GAMM|nr:NUDIX domain-containing protein [Enterobacillus tribolii]MBW7981929.1 NUDIX domain-containing protein [Enterobacillus tribolii]RDK90052.1 ADP-ribose pyrophosphatase YjhB (NUDIX family) [Enterobacillus tribolii]